MIPVNKLRGLLGGGVALLALTGCVVGGGGGYDDTANVSYGVGFYEPLGYNYGGWGPGYRVAPPRGGEPRRDRRIGRSTPPSRRGRRRPFPAARARATETVAVGIRRQDAGAALMQPAGADAPTVWAISNRRAPPDDRDCRRDAPRGAPRAWRDHGLPI